LREVSGDFDIVHAHNYACFPALYAAQAKSRNKLVFTPHYHGVGHTFFRSLLHKPYKLLGKRIFDKADKIVCVSEYEKNLITTDFILDQEKMVVIPNGVNLQEFATLRRRSKDHRVILYVGRLEEYKGVQYLVRVLPMLGTNEVLEIVGKGSYEKRLSDLAKELNVDDRVKFIRDLPRTELLQKYVDADVFVLLSKHEAYSISVAEALAARVPCVVARTSALRQWVDDVNCFGIDYPINLDELATLIGNAMETNVHEMHIPDWNEIAERTADLYELLLDSRREN
jgi:glycosyltransferase involved in cell wall biosynthesis